METLERKMEKKALKAAVCRVIFCPACGAVMDVSRSALLETPESINVRCRDCAEAILAKIEKARGPDFLAHAIETGSLQIIRGYRAPKGTRKVEPKIVASPPVHIVAKKPTIPKTWCGDVTECQMCKGPIENWFVDGKTGFGAWALMCLPCHEKYGCGLGEGKGQEYRRNGDVWEKTRG